MANGFPFVILTAALFVQVAVNAEQPAGPQAASVPAVPSDEKNAGNEVTENPAMPPVLEDVIESMEGGISAIHSVEDRLQKDLEMMMSVEKELRDNGALNSAAGEEPLIEGASAGSVITMILKRMRDDTAAMKSMMVKEMDDIRRMVNYDTSVTSRIMQLFPAVDIQGTLEAMKGAVTQQMELLQTILGSGANLPNSIL
ncbi:hypothetical protein TGRUB_202090 [Toxoplasma gondii RUB]|uniref:Uncharacterized protein n=9 Tax=Toxoplasma gondii TaxID=5811 RepID=B9PUQ6_TOXGV|nr:hypothetical protein TGGT1_202090 [Toxoplasma gondii GT1]ESS33020.1 hypothetical protein TGVEG_202090 [Toxoplasma gondii VEG]KFG41084.1 hypothetical protein TGDOM2_202090 [Toxoplasma gondii GAB2-2007-GAL-DOM2]KFG53589.1 hypothetical protein TGFOU_202090 [Toxoplasma gondii FOU]KFG62034.1 hypothetical protein TGRUB_202090 [Toxoplasma gondii RUB]KFH06962.1 hypothetical protein TGVAND_202090 [Toxoplasma gondii VAND]KFH11651.1 hypothetical protein TGMAS_202090 [Toxoplasma gondii MAS]PIL99793.1